MLEIRHLSKSFGPIRAVDDITFSVGRGEVLGFLGPNGAGKSTTMKMITGFIAPTAGTAVVLGHDIVSDPIRAKSKMGYLPEGAPAYPDMTPAAFLGFIAEIRGFGGREARRRVGAVVEMVHLNEVLEQPIETLSKGFKRRVGLAQALLHDPEVLILDEPTDGLDPNQKHEVRGLIERMAPSKAIIISTHLLEEVDAVCTRAMIIARGRVLADGTPAELSGRSRFHNAVRLSVKRDALAAIRTELMRLPSVASVDEVADSDGIALMIFARGPTPPIAEISDLARAHGWEISGLRVEHGRLDDVFRDITMPAPLPALPPPKAA